MTRKDYIAGLEKIRKQVTEIGKAFAAVDLTDATDMESDRRKKTAKIVCDLRDRLYEDIAISQKVAADNKEAGRGEQGDLFDAAEEAKNAKTDKAKNAEVVDVTTIPAKGDMILIEDKSDAKPNDGKPGKKSGKGKGKKNGKKGGAK